MTKIIYVYEGVEPVTAKGKRHRLVGAHYFCRCTEDNKALWDEVYAYIDACYDLSKVKKVYLNADGGAWIKSGLNRLHGVEYVLDEFHLSKYLLKMTKHMMDTQEDARIELCKAIRSKNKESFVEITQRLLGCTTNENVIQRITESAEYILDNWSAAKQRLRHKDSIYGCSAEGHVYHVLSSRMSTLAMGWSKTGIAKMAQLREWKYNKISSSSRALPEPALRQGGRGASLAAPARQGYPCRSVNGCPGAPRPAYCPLTPLPLP